jgi:small subunit ribosomal protein S20
MFDPFFSRQRSISAPLMANTKSAIKNARKARRRMLRNKAVITRLKTLRAKLHAAMKSGDPAAAKSAAIAYVSAVDRAARGGVVHANAAAHVKSHTAKLVFAK